MPDENKAVLLTANAAISRLDFEGFLACCTDDIKWTMVGDRAIEGKQAVRHWMGDAYVEPPEFDVKSLIADAEFVVAVGEITVKDKMGGSVRSRYCDVWRFRDGKMAELNAYVIALPPGSSV